jgi:hypothetical protein
MREHAKENFKIGVLVYVIVFITGWGPIFGYHLFFKIPRDIRNGAAHQPGHKLPEKLAHLPSPSWIYELSPPSISIYIKPISGFTFVAKLPPGNYSFKDRQEYELTIKNNGGITATSINLEIQPPLLLIASKIIFTRGVSGTQFEPIDHPVVSSFGGGNVGVGIGGCYVNFTYIFVANSLARNGSVKILLVMENNEQVLKDFPFNRSENGAVDSYIFGYFNYRYNGVLERGRYYAPFEIRDGIVTLLGPIEERSKMTTRRGFTFVAPPCIPPDALK